MMKKFALLFLLLVPLLGKAQNNTHWSFSLNFDLMVADDTVIWPEKNGIYDNPLYSRFPNVAACWSTWTFDVSDAAIDTSFQVAMGGSNLGINDTIWGFSYFDYDSLPYTLDPDLLRDTINGVPQVQKTIKLDFEYGFEVPGLRIWKLTTDTGIMTGRATFAVGRIR